MGLENYTTTEFTCDNCGKDLLKKKIVIYNDIEFCHLKRYFCNKKCEKDYYDYQIYSCEEAVKDIVGEGDEDECN